jgi:hypothetical protein
MPQFTHTFNMMASGVLFKSSTPLPPALVVGINVVNAPGTAIPSGIVLNYSSPTFLENPPTVEEIWPSLNQIRLNKSYSSGWPTPGTLTFDYFLNNQSKKIQCNSNLTADLTFAPIYDDCSTTINNSLNTSVSLQIAKDVSVSINAQLAVPTANILNSIDCASEQIEPSLNVPTANLVTEPYDMSCVIRPQLAVSAQLNYVLTIKTQISPTLATYASLSAELFLSSTKSKTILALKSALDYANMGLGVCHAARDILRVWGSSMTKSTTDAVREAAINTLNQSLQLLWSLAQSAQRDYFTRRTLTITLAPGQTEIELDNIQNVIGHVRLADTKRPLRLLSSRTQIDQFADIFGQTTTNQPVAFFVERLNSSQPDACRVILHITPAPTTPTDVLADVVYECPRYILKDYCTCPPIPIPHRYAESVLLPIARKLAMSSEYYKPTPERTASINEEFALALKTLGVVDPQLIQAARRETIEKQQHTQTTT